MTSGLELLQRMARGEVPPPPVAKLIGLELVEVEAGHAVFRLRAEERHTNPPFWAGTLTATGRVVKRTRKTGLAEAEVVDEKGSLVAKAKSTCLVLDGEDAKGR